MRIGAVVARRVHNPEVGGASPSSASNFSFSINTNMKILNILNETRYAFPNYVGWIDHEMQKQRMVYSRIPVHSYNTAVQQLTDQFGSPYYSERLMKAWFVINDNLKYKISLVSKNDGTSVLQLMLPKTNEEELIA